MNPSHVLVALTAVLLTVDATFVIGTAGTVGVGAASAAVALAGVVGLALGAGAVGAGALAFRGRRRGRRDVAALKREDMLFDVVAAADAYGCALKLVCQIEAKPDSQIELEDELILNLFGRQPSAVAENEIATSRQAYFYAASLGVNQGSDACGSVFHTCQFSYEQMMDYVRALRG